MWSDGSKPAKPRLSPVQGLLGAENCCISAHSQQRIPPSQDTQLSLWADGKQLSLEQPQLTSLGDWFSSQFKSREVAVEINMHRTGIFFDLSFFFFLELNI